MDPFHIRLGIVISLVEGMYETIQHLLGGLPLEVAVPPLFVEGDQDGTRQVKAVQALAHARAILEDEPISVDQRRAFSALILKWLTAYHLAAAAQSAEEDYMLDAAQLALYEAGGLIGKLEAGEDG